MKPHLPATLRRALLAALAIATLTPSARADLTLGSDDTLIIDYATDSTLPPADADGVLTLNGDTKLQLNNCGTGDGKTYTIITGVSGLVDKDGNALTDYAASVYFDTTQPG
ncbi:MAG: hypothetical protein IKK15_04225, partial [Akkermansia sp.]|nr:hypothetical protein [Akkermansia sp.]